MLNQLRHAARLVDGFTGSGDMRLLEPIFAQADLDVAEASSLLSPLLYMQDSTRPRDDVLDAQGRKEKTFQALLALFDGYVRNAHILMIFEDLHWADPDHVGISGTIYRPDQRSNRPGPVHLQAGHRGSMGRWAKL